MGNFFSRVFGGLMGPKEYRILMLGLNNAGKTTILFKMNLGDYIQVAPSKALLFSTSNPASHRVQRRKRRKRQYQVPDMGSRR